MVKYFEINEQEAEKLISSPLAPRQKAYHEIMWLQKGIADFMIDGDVFHLRSNTFFVLPRERYHQFLPHEIVQGQVIRFSEDFLDDFPRLLFSKFNYISEVKVEGTDEKAFELLYQLFKMEYFSNPKNLHVLTNLLKTIIYKLDNVKQQQFPDCQACHYSVDLFDQFQLLLDKHIIHQRRVSFYADLLNITPRKLGETIKSLLNDTTEGVISQRLLIEAKRQLTYTNKSVTEIAYSLDFQDNSYFTKFFKKLTNTTPKEFRKRNNLAK